MIELEPSYQLNYICGKLSSQAWTNCAPGARAQNPETCPILRARNSCLVNNKNILDLQVFNRIGKTIKKLQ